MKCPASTPAPPAAAIIRKAPFASSNLPFLLRSCVDQPCAPFRFVSLLLRLAPPRPSSDSCSAVWSFASARSSAVLLPTRHSRTHTSLQVFPSRKKKFQCLEVSAHD